MACCVVLVLVCSRVGGAAVVRSVTGANVARLFQGGDALLLQRRLSLSPVSKWDADGDDGGLMGGSDACVVLFCGGVFWRSLRVNRLPFDRDRIGSRHRARSEKGPRNFGGDSAKSVEPSKPASQPAATIIISISTPLFLRLSMVAPAMALLGAPSLRPGSLASIRVPALSAFGALDVAAPARACFSTPNRSLVSTAATPAHNRSETAQHINAMQQIDEPSRPQQYKDVVLSSLPLTATPFDIRSLALGKIRNDLARIEFLYTKSMRPSGRAIASFSNAGNARTFEEIVQGRILGGRQVQARLQSAERRDAFLQSYYASWSRHYQLPLDLIEYERGTLVLLRNIPQDTFEARLEERLAGRYDLRQQDRWRGKRTAYPGYFNDKKGYGGSHDVVLGGVLKLPKAHPDATTASFIVRCQSAFEANRLVRRWHNTYFAPATFDIQDTAGRYRVAASVLY
ncbi:uncharacterized protein PAN0_044d6388 [Moesziomyces antarcticus]|uniref:RRM domain-containing protein n=1 Tax=Pseudozyma antarctica TaxID=84753 RepID=A0A081CNA7_PSEA2|nr:uncharacterized protein PAN0_044d6388 [Moesziomyces antarcticus]GAK68153.1 conserved hypothetical protein [Moesziomyces antarcticus]